VRSKLGAIEAAGRFWLLELWLFMLRPGVSGGVLQMMLTESPPCFGASVLIIRLNCKYYPLS
jgi:hypothetical protein